MTIKPHLYYLVVLRIVFEAIRHSHFVSITRAVVFSLAVALATTLLYPGLITNWTDVLIYGAQGPHQPIQSWKVVTLVYPIRWALDYIPTIDSKSLMGLIPALTATTCMWLWIRRRGAGGTNLAYLMVLSYLTSPYGWVSDQIVLLPAVIIGLLRTAEYNQPRAAIYGLLWLSLQIVGRVFKGSLFDAEHKYLWLPVCTGLLLLCAEYQRQRALKARATAECSGSLQ
ncbi:MAG: hypothetical protein EBZ48_02690 [Proteobacteria bacterium]|nr:hypothetical protein [Pseudomonadota bacterium]